VFVQSSLHVRKQRFINDKSRLPEQLKQKVPPCSKSTRNYPNTSGYSSTRSIPWYNL